MTKRFIFMLLAAGLILGGIFGWKAFVGFQMQQGMANMVLPPVTVSTAEAQSTQWVPKIPAVGSLRAEQGVDVTPQLAGQITRLHFESGQVVQAGDLLVSQYTADDEAELAGLLADTQLAELNLKRTQELREKKLASEFDFDLRRTDLERARAAEANQRLVIEQKSIRAPFTGRLGIREVDVGQYVEPGDTLVRLEAIDDILVRFPVPQKFFSQLSVGQPIVVTTDAWPDEEFPGTIRALEPQIARDTRNIRVQGVISNAEQKLLPGMFARIDIVLPTQNDVTTVPQSAVTYSPYGDSVFVVNDNEGDDAPTVRNAFVQTGATRGDQVAITTGLMPGELVVTSGQQKLTNGARVRVDNTVQVSDQPDPDAANN